MTRSRKLSAQTVAVLAALSLRSSDWLYGLELSRLTGLKSGSLYPILIRLADRGLLESRWLDPIEPGRPARHAYRVSPTGMKALADSSSRPAPAPKEARI
ncbi:MAG: PadR family transcriptional regulator [Pseudomonadota bacterium]|nr:PadR family transcriptional regulator [Pseudomonadota bacterium]